MTSESLWLIIKVMSSLVTYRPAVVYTDFAPHFHLGPMLKDLPAETRGLPGWEHVSLSLFKCLTASAQTKHVSVTFAINIFAVDNIVVSNFAANIFAS